MGEREQEQNDERPQQDRLESFTGARFRVRADAIEGLEQSSQESRELWRRFREERDRENPPEIFPF